MQTHNQWSVSSRKRVICSMYTMLHLECCKCARMRFHCESSGGPGQLRTSEGSLVAYVSNDVEKNRIGFDSSKMPVRSNCACRCAAPCMRARARSTPTFSARATGAVRFVVASDDTREACPQAIYGEMSDMWKMLILLLTRNLNTSRASPRSTPLRSGFQSATRSCAWTLPHPSAFA